MTLFQKQCDCETVALPIPALFCFDCFTSAPPNPHSRYTQLSLWSESLDQKVDLTCLTCPPCIYGWCWFSVLKFNHLNCFYLFLCAHMGPYSSSFSLTLTKAWLKHLNHLKQVFCRIFLPAYVASVCLISDIVCVCLFLKKGWCHALECFIQLLIF